MKTSLRFHLAFVLMLSLFSTVQAQTYSVGDKIEAVENGKWYKATVLKVQGLKVQGAKYFIRWDGYDAKYDAWVSPAEMRLPSQTQASTQTVNSAAKKWNVGDRVEIKNYDEVYKREKIYPAIIVSVESGGYRVNYDGYAESYDETVSADKLQPLSPVAGVPYLKAEKGKTVSVKSDLSGGKIIDLDWAQASGVACFPGTRFVEFEGNHVFYWMDLPRRSILKITVKPTDGKRINVYAYSGFEPQYVPPNVPRCLSCEASHETWVGTNPPADFTKASSKDGGVQSVELNATTNRYGVLIGVAGAKGVVSGKYELQIELK